MNKYSSLSTSVLLALLTSSAAAQDYANGTTPQARSEAYVSSADNSKNKNDDATGETKSSDDDDVQRLTQEGIDQLAQGASKLLDASSVKAKEWSQALSSASGEALDQARSSASDALAALSQAAQNVSSALKQDNSAPAGQGVVAQSTTAPVTAQAGDSTAGSAAPLPTAMVRTDYQLDLKQLNPDLVGAQLPKHLALSFEHPQELKESFMVAGNDVIIAFGNDDGNFQISLKLRPLEEQIYRKLTMDDLKQDVTHRFSDKESMLYGQYEITQELSDYSQGPGQPYLDLSILAFLKKGEDGILPDLQSYFSERNVVSRQYHATLSCELRGRQVQAPVVAQQFELLKPLCTRVISSLSLSFD